LRKIIHIFPNRDASTENFRLCNDKEFSVNFHDPAEIWGGMAAAAVVLPQAIAFGVALLLPFGFNPSAGAIAGLIGAAALGFVSGISGGTLGLISSSTGPVLILLGGALASLVNAGLARADVLAGLSTILMVTGVTQIIIGIPGGGRLIKFMTCLVVAGFMSGSALLMILSQVKTLSSGSDISSGWEIWHLIPIATTAITLALVAYMLRIIPAIPGTIVDLIGGTIVLQGFILFVSTPIPEIWIIGALPGPESIEIIFTVSAVRELPWTTIIASALAILASFNTLLTSVIADIGTGVRHNAKRELIGQGAGQIASGIFGGMAGSGTTGATLVAVKAGGRRWAGISAGLSFILLVLVGGPIGYVLPISVLAGIILYVAIRMLEKDIFAWLNGKSC